jgi:ribosomal protein S18 acetylase RimI-like enzyme
LEIRTIYATEIEAARQLLLAAGWDRAVSNAAEFRILLSRSQLTLVAIEDGQVVGFLRALSDGIANAYLSMLVVDERHRRKGIARALVAAAMGDDKQMTWVLRAVKEVTPFYEKLGFTKSEVAMERPGKKNANV